MTPKKKKNVGRKSKEQKRKERYLLFMVLLVAFSMLFSGFYFFGSGDGKIPTPRQEERPYFLSYDIRPVGDNVTLLVNVDEVRPELIAIVKSQCISFQSISWVYNTSNTSVPGLKGIICEVAGPVKRRHYDLCGNLIFFKFTFEDIDGNTTDKLRGELNNRMGEYVLKRAYTGILPMNLSGPGTDSIYVFGDLDVGKGDYAKIFLFQKSSDGSLFGLGRKRIHVGPVVPADVVNLTDIMVQGNITSDFYPNTIEEDINVSSTQIRPPKILVNDLIDNETVEEISELDVSVETRDNRTEISFNSSLKDIREILDRKKLEYSLEKGILMIRIPLNSSVDRVERVLSENGIEEQLFKKNGLVKVPDEVLINGRLVRIDNPDRFSVILNMETNVSDRINVTLSSLQFGEQEFVIGGVQTA